MSLVFEAINIENYRGLRSVCLSELGFVNIFVGNNNSGKTSLLEAISILCNPLDPFQWIGLSQRRAYLNKTALLRPDLEAIQWIFFRKDEDSDYPEISLEGRGRSQIQIITASVETLYGASLEDNGVNAWDNALSSAPESATPGVELKVIAALSELGGLFPNSSYSQQEIFQFWEKERFIDRHRKARREFVKSEMISPSYSSDEPILYRFSKIAEKEGDKEKILELIRLFDHNILDIKISSTKTNKPILKIHHQQIGSAPLPIFGDGLKRVLIMALVLMTLSQGVLLIDEIETSIHISILGKVFFWLTQACEARGTQLFVTTHSLEAVDAILNAGIPGQDIVGYKLNSSGLSPQRFSGDLLYRLRLERGLDIRR
ncbi:MAG: AAA family ATPase [Cyanobacteria bacterium RI_101]|nr:AAA family ATPase [Cyanobacteria bacterium RI_101]